MSKTETTTANEGGKKVYKRHEFKSEARAVLAFLGKCGPFEADAIRVLAIMSGRELTAEAKDAINLFLDYGSKSKDISLRIERAELLINHSLELIEGKQLPRITAMLMRLATDTAMPAMPYNAPQLPFGDAD